MAGVSGEGGFAPVRPSMNDAARRHDAAEDEYDKLLKVPLNERDSVAIRAATQRALEAAKNYDNLLAGERGEVGKRITAYVMALGASGET